MYAYLRRLGYIVLRKSHVDAIHRSSSSAVLRSPHPAVSTSLIRRLIDWHLLPSRHLLAVLSYPLRRLWYGLDWALRREYWGASGVLIRPGYWPNYGASFALLVSYLADQTRCRLDLLRSPSCSCRNLHKFHQASVKNFVRRLRHLLLRVPADEPLRKVGPSASRVSDCRR